MYVEYASSKAKTPKYIQRDSVGDREFKLDVVLKNPVHKQE